MNAESTINNTAERAPKSLWKTIMRILELSYAYRYRLAAAVALSLLAASVWLVVPLGLRGLLDAVFEEGNRVLLNQLALGLLVLFVLQAGFSFAGGYLLEWTGERIVADLRGRIYAHLHSLDLRFFSKQRTGELTSRLTNDVSTIQTSVTSGLVDLLRQSLTFVGSIGLMMILNWRLSLIVFVVVPLVTIIARHFGRKIRVLARGVQDHLADTTAVAEEALAAIRVVKAFAREPYEIEKYRSSVEDLFETARENVFIRMVFSSVVGLLFFLALTVIFWFGGNEVLAGRLSAGDLVAFIFYAFNISGSVGGLSQLYTVFNRAAGASERLFELLDRIPDVRDVPNAISLPELGGTVCFDRLSFSYEPDTPVLSNINVSVEHGETVALVGPSGAGKTTLLNLIPRFFDPTEGRLLIDGHDIRTLQTLWLREKIGVVPQDIHLFSGSILENIRYGRLGGTREDVENAARMANAEEFILQLPLGYDTAVGERGMTLSGGQRQRVAIARAILKDAPILLLDEATSALDSASESLVQEALQHLMQGRTTFVIAHRLSTVQHADRILVMSEGRIVQQGTHSELISEDGLYRKLAAYQFEGVSVANGRK